MRTAGACVCTADELNNREGCHQYRDATEEDCDVLEGIRFEPRNDLWAIEKCHRRLNSKADKAKQHKGEKEPICADPDGAGGKNERGEGKRWRQQVESGD